MSIFSTHCSSFNVPSEPGSASEPGWKVVRGILGLVVKGRSSGATSPFINEMKAPLLPRCAVQCEESNKENSEAGGCIKRNKDRKETVLKILYPPLETHHEQTDC